MASIRGDVGDWLGRGPEEEGGEPDPEHATAAERTCEEICRMLTNSETLVVGAWEREMDTVLERMRAANSAVFSATVNSGWVRRRLLHFVALFGNRAVLEEGCARTWGSPTEAAQTLDTEGDMLLHLVVRNKRLTAEDVQWVVSLQPAAVSTANASGDLPLHLLVRHHASLTSELVDIILEAHPQALQAANHHGYSPVRYACLNSRMTAPALHHLVSLHTAAAQTASQNGNLPLHLLVFNNKLLTPELVDAVAQTYPRALQTPNRHGKLPLHYACDNPHITAPVLRYLVSLYTAAAQTASQDGNLPLHLLMISSKLLTPDLIDASLEAYPQALQTANRHGKLPLHYACGNSHIALPALRSLVDLNPAAAGVPDQQGALPLHFLVRHQEALTPDFVEVVAQAHAQALQTVDVQGNLPLHWACHNVHLTAPALRRLLSLHGAAAGAANRDNEVPLHTLLWKHEAPTPELVNVLLEAYPQALGAANRDGDLPLHHACKNSNMTAEALRAALEAFPDAAAIANGIEHLPYHSLSAAMSDTVRCRLATMLMEVTDSLFPCETLAADAKALPFSLADQRYVIPPPDPRWASRKHPLSRQGRLRAGLHVAIRGRENVWQFQTGGMPLPSREMVDGVSLVDLVQAGHISLVRQRLARASAWDANGATSAVLRALELGHVEIVRELLTGRSAAVRVSCTAERACEWLGAMMRHSGVRLHYSWLVEWMGEQRGAWGAVDLNWLCLEAAAYSGRLGLVESMAAVWQTMRGHGSPTDKNCEDLATRAVYGGSVAVLRLLQAASLATFPARAGMDPLIAALAKRDRVEMLELVHKELRWTPGAGAVRAAMEGGAIRVLRWLHVHTRLAMDAADFGAAMFHGHGAVVQFLHRHRNISNAWQRSMLAKAVRHSVPGTLGVVEYVLRHSIVCSAGNDAVMRQLVEHACTANTVRVDVVRYVVSQASENVLLLVDEDLSNSGQEQALSLFRAARERLP